MTATRLRRVAASVALGFALTGVAVAQAAWTTTAAGAAQAVAGTLGAPQMVSATVSGTSVTVTWKPPPGLAPSDYVVARAGASVPVCTTTAESCVDGPLAAGTYEYTVAARLGGWTSAAMPVVAPIAAAPVNRTFDLQIVGPAPKTAGTTFSVVITAKDDGATTTSYSGQRTLTWTGASASLNGTAPTLPATASFADGVATVQIVLFRADLESTVIGLADGSRSGTTAIAIVAANPSRLELVDSSPDCSEGHANNVGNGRFTARVRRVDDFGNPAMAGVASLTVTRSPENGGLSVPPSYSIFSAQSTTVSAFSFDRPNGSSGGNTHVVTVSSPGLAPATCRVNK